jgi:hypothetical protein
MYVVLQSNMSISNGVAHTYVKACETYIQTYLVCWFCCSHMAHHSREFALALLWPYGRNMYIDIEREI